MKSAVQIIFIMQLMFLMFNKCSAQTHKLRSVKIECEGFYTETVFDVSCDAFDFTFLKTKKVKFFHDNLHLSSIRLLLNDFKQAKKQSIDVRGSIVYHYGKTTAKYCFDKFGCFYKDGKMYYNKKLLIYISDKIYGNHPEYLDTLRQYE